MLIVFEITLVQQQKRNMAMIRQMGNQPYKISVFRQRKWVKIDYDRYITRRSLFSSTK